MSRYRIPTKEVHYKAYVGWDNPQSHFFAQLYNLKEEADGNDGLKLDAEINAIPSPENGIQSLEGILKSFAQIPDFIKEQLLKDYKERTEPTPLQKQFTQLFKE